MKILISNISKKSYHEFNKLMDELYPNAKVCKNCGKHIFYYDTKIIEITPKNQTKKVKKIIGKSFLTQKSHGENLCICENCLINKYPEYEKANKLRVFNTINEITAYAFDIKERSIYFTGPTKERCIHKHGYNKGLKIWSAYCVKQSKTNTFKYKQQKYGMNREEFTKFNKSRAITERNLIKKYGEITGKEKWRVYLEKQKETKSLDYMIKKFGKKKAKLINKSKGITLNNFINKYGETEGTERFIKIINKQYSFFSKVSQIFFKKIDALIKNQYTTYYASKNTEFGVNLSIGYIRLDYFIKELNLCIEFNGDIFHANPKYFDEKDYPNPFNKKLTAKEIRMKDKIRYDTLKKEKNINTLVIWESDSKTLDISEFINKNIH